MLALVAFAMVATFMALIMTRRLSAMVALTAAMIPLYRHLKMEPRQMACIIIMSGAVMNILPWAPSRSPSTIRDSPTSASESRATPAMRSQSPAWFLLACLLTGAFPLYSR
jgi:CitMHS family citrate-Mg2+:H+ or citrate-Ca2+:H+ symporter